MVFVCLFVCLFVSLVSGLMVCSFMSLLLQLNGIFADTFILLLIVMPLFSGYGYNRTLVQINNVKRMSFSRLRKE